MDETKLTELMDYVIHENQDVSAGQKKRFKFPMIAADALSSEAEVVLDFFFKDASGRTSTHSRLSEMDEDHKTNDGGEKPPSEGIEFSEPDPENQSRSTEQLEKKVTGVQEESKETEEPGKEPKGKVEAIVSGSPELSPKNPVENK